MKKNIELKESQDERMAVLIAETIFYVYGESQEYKDVVAWLKEHMRVDILDEEERKFADAKDSYRNMKILEKILIVVGGLQERGYKIKYFDKDNYGRYRIDIKRHEDDFWQSEEYKEYEKILGDSLIEGTYGSDIYTLWIKADEEQTQEIEVNVANKYIVP